MAVAPPLLYLGACKEKEGLARQTKDKCTCRHTCFCRASVFASSHFRNTSTSCMLRNSKDGERIWFCSMTFTYTPPDLIKAVAPRVVDATSAPSVVAKGHNAYPLMWSPNRSNGPAMPTGTFTSPIGFSMFPFRFKHEQESSSPSFLHHSPVCFKLQEANCSAQWRRWLHRSTSK